MMLDKKEFIEKATLIYHSGYNANFNAFTSMVRLSRLPILRRNGFFMAALQSNMLKTLAGFQDELRNAQKEVREAKDDESKKKAERSVLVQRQWIRVLQTIADGIAWRSYRFNRPLLRVMSENSAPGDLKQDGYDYVGLLRKLLIAAPRFSLRIANDLTRVLRIADITLFYSTGEIMLYEVKEKGGKIIDTGSILAEMRKHRVWPNPQKLRQLVAQMAIINEKIDVPVVEKGKVIKRVEVDVVNLDFKIAHHFRALRRLIRKASRNIFAAETVEEGYYIEVTDGERLQKSELDRLKKEKSSIPTWTKKSVESILKVSNFDSFIDAGTEFPRNILPYSVLPLSAQNCTKMMMGHLQVFISVDTSVLRKKLINRGWRVTDRKPWEEMAKETTTRVHMFDQKADSTFFDIEKDDDGATYRGAVLLDDILMMATSFYGFDFVLDSADAMFESSKADKKRQRFVTRNYLGERRVLI